MTWYPKFSIKWLYFVYWTTCMVGGVATTLGFLTAVQHPLIGILIMGLGLTGSILALQSILNFNVRDQK